MAALTDLLLLLLLNSLFFVSHAAKIFNTSRTNQYYCGGNTGCCQEQAGFTNFRKFSCGEECDCKVTMKKNFFAHMRRRGAQQMKWRLTFELNFLDDVPQWYESNFPKPQGPIRVEYLRIRKTNLQLIKEGLFESLKFQFINELLIEGNKQLKVLPARFLTDKNVWSTTEGIKTVKIRDNNIVKISNNAFQNTRIAELTIEEKNMVIEEFAFNGTTIEVLTLRYVKTLPNIKRVNALKLDQITIRDFYFHMIPEGYFPNRVSHIQFENKLSPGPLRIDKKAFQNLRLGSLILNSCKIEDILPGTLDRSVVVIEDLSLRRNRLTTLSTEDLKTQDDMTNLFLTDNKFKSVSEAFSGMIFQKGHFPNLVIVDLSNNLLQSFPPPPSTLTRIGVERQMDVILTGNPFICDCKLKWMKTNDTSPKWKPWVENHVSSNLKCAWPKGFTLARAFEKGLTCVGAPPHGVYDTVKTGPTKPGDSEKPGISGKQQIQEEVVAIIIVVVVVVVAVLVFVVCFKFRHRLCPPHSSAETTKYSPANKHEVGIAETSMDERNNHQQAV